MEQKIVEILAEIKPILAERKNGNFICEGLLESMEIMDIVVKLEEELNITIEPEDIIPDYFVNVSTLIKLVEKSR